jgi:hypothetical protein
MATTPAELVDALPPTIEGWSKAGDAEVYDPKTLFQYINGGAELYISFDFKTLAAVRYGKGEDLEITVDVFDMGSSHNAFGVFSHGRESTGGKVGQGSEYASGLLHFWKDRFYVSVMAYPESAETRKVVEAIAIGIAAAIPEKGEIPPVVSRLPAQDLVPESVRYFHHHTWLNRHYFVADTNILRIGRRTESVLARYTGSAGSYLVLLVEYPDARQARQAELSFLRTYLPEAVNGLAQLEDGRWTGVTRTGDSLVVVLDAAASDAVKAVWSSMNIEKE